VEIKKENIRFSILEWGRGRGEEHGDGGEGNKGGGEVGRERGRKDVSSRKPFREFCQHIYISSLSNPG
jgi:hypothetical protein